jgi:thiosulfate dehydrogenase [quinone] large subunit
MVDRSEATTMTEQNVRPVLSMRGLLIVEMIIGYEWLISGLVKVVRGEFPSGLAATLLEKLPRVPGWYGSFLSGAIIPNAPYFGYAIEIAELLAGVVLLGGPVIALFAWERVPHWMRKFVLFFTAVAAIGGAFLAINLHIANAASHPWFFPGDSFDEGVDLDSVLPAIQLVIAWISIVLLRRLGRETPDGVGAMLGSS